MSAELRALGRALLLVGVLLAVCGAIMLAGPRVPWLGRLPGDIRIERNGFSFYAPLASCLVVSALVSLIVWVIGRFRQ
jgi:hypothetical protein